MLKPHNKAFSLLELALVIVVVSLILFLTITNSNISANAKLKLLGKEVSNLQNLYSNFYANYSYYPGDFINAADFFGCTSGSAPSGCNGNGNGFIDDQAESYRFFEHLELAKMIETNMTGIANGSEPYSSSANLYASKNITSALFYPTDESSSSEYPNTAHNKLIMGRFSEAYIEAQIGVLSPQDAMSYDLKYDDGKPRLGKVIARTFLNTANSRDGLASNLCLTSIESNIIANISASTYNATSELELCEMHFLF